MPTSPQGIDFHEALAILSSRSVGKEEEHKEDPTCPCQAPTGEAANFGNMGQIINLEGGKSNGKATSSNEVANGLPTKTKQELFDSFRIMSTRQLMQAVSEAQQKRVAAYREYDRGLQAILATNNVGYYPTLCTEATAAFSVVSDTLRTLQDEIKGRQGGNEYLALIQQLQKHEQVKLHYTAAYHMEQIRLNQVDKDDLATKKLLEESNASLQSKLSGCVDIINEALEEIQCAVVDAPSDDGASK